MGKALAAGLERHLNPQADSREGIAVIQTIFSAAKRREG